MEKWDMSGPWVFSQSIGGKVTFDLSQDVGGSIQGSGQYHYSVPGEGGAFGVEGTASSRTLSGSMSGEIFTLSVYWDTNQDAVYNCHVDADGNLINGRAWDMTNDVQATWTADRKAIQLPAGEPVRPRQRDDVILGGGEVRPHPRDDIILGGDVRPPPSTTTVTVLLDFESLR